MTMNTRGNGFDSHLSIQEASDATWRVIAPLIWTGTQGDRFTVPVGFVTDFATVPRFLIWKVRPYGRYTRAAVLHDWLLVELAEHAVRWQGRQADGIGPGPSAFDDEPPASSRDADGIFRRVMEDLGVPWMTRWQMWAAVRVAALFNSRRSYGRDFGKDAGKVVGILLITSPVLLPGAIGVLISLGIAWPFTRQRPVQAPAGTR